MAVLVGQGPQKWCSGTQYAVPQITNKSYLRGGSGICALEAYHAGAVRMQLLQNSTGIIEPWGVDALTITQARLPCAVPSAPRVLRDPPLTLS